jgi:hypothetical protein
VNTGQHLAAALTSLALFLSGCSGTPGFEYPTAKVASVRVDQQSDQGVRVVVVVNLNNPNDYPLPLVEGSYTVNLAGIGAFSDSAKSERTLPSRGTETVELPAAFATHGQSAAGCSYEVHGSVTCNPPSAFRALMSDLYIPLPSTYISSSGVVSATAETPVPPAPPTTAP